MKINNQKGMTLVEIVIVLVVMALLAAAALPKIFSVITNAKKGSRDHIVAAVRSGIFLYKLSTVSETNPLGSYPYNSGSPVQSLDSNVGGFICSGAATCFGNVLDSGQAIDDSRWYKDGAGLYLFDSAGSANSTYTYNTTNGSFLCSAGVC